ncbi:MAG: (d)CMP kinase [Saprospiraceae bacterium]|nr:(d)CMP kinase [Saprospiraceae bacterium]
MNRKINIAIDGHSSCGKSTLAKDLAKHFEYIYIDSGAMYRAVAYYLLERDIDPSDHQKVISVLGDILIQIKNEVGKFRILLNGRDITEEIVSIRVSSIVSEVAAISAVRKKLVGIQQELGKDKGVVMDGRDIGTVVFPDAEVKLFITADPDIRAQRRFDELVRKDMSTPFDEVKANLLHRDHIDSTREDSPLKMAEGAILIDNSFMDREEQLFISSKIVEEKLR